VYKALHNTDLVFSLGTVIALYTIGGMFGALSCIFLGDLLGRRRTIFLASGVSIIGAILMSSSFSLAQFIVARIVLGLGTGGYTATVPVWQSELSKASHRGAHVVTEGIFIGAGIALSLWIDFGFYFITWSSVAWRFPLAFQIVLSLMVMAFIFTLPESPRWLIKKNRLNEAREILAILEDVHPNSDKINADMEEIQMSLSIAGTGSIWDMLKMGQQRILHRTLLAATGQMFQQMCGINLITFYATTIFQQDLGLDATKSRILAAAMEICQPLGGFLAFFTIDRFGRRKLMLISAAGMAVSMAVLAGTTSNVNNQGALTVAVVFLFIFNFIFPIGFLGLTFLYATEVAPLHLRAAISGVATATTWIFNFLIAEITPVGFNTIQYRYYIIYAAINAFIIPVVYFCFPETNGRSLEEMDEIFARSKNIFDPPRIARALPRTREAGHTVVDSEKSVQNTDFRKKDRETDNGTDMVERVENNDVTNHANDEAATAATAATAL